MSDVVSDQKPAQKPGQKSAQKVAAASSGETVSAETLGCLRGSGVLLVGHGTRDELGSDEFFQLGRILQQQLGEIPVEPSLLEFQTPTIPDAWKRLAERLLTRSASQQPDSPERIQVAPLLLFAAGHAKSDIPEIVDSCRQNTLGIKTNQSKPLSRHPAVIELVLQRLQQTIKASGAVARQTHVVMVGRGSYDPCAQADMRVLTELVRHRSRIEHFSTAFYAMATPSLPKVLADVARGSGSNALPETIIVHPHLLFHGRLYQAIVKQVEEAAERFPKIRFVTGDYLGPDPRIARAIIDRVIETV